MTPQKNFIDRFTGNYSDIIARAVSYTTREKKADEVEGVSYYFVTKEKFDEMKAANKFVTINELGGHSYGTTVESIEQIRKQGKVAFRNVDLLN